MATVRWVRVLWAVFYIIFEFLQEKIRKPMEEEPDVQVLLEKEKSEVERERK